MAEARSAAPWSVEVTVEVTVVETETRGSDMQEGRVRWRSLEEAEVTAAKRVHPTIQTLAI